jgi:signal transduction histidine kinase
VKLRLRTKFLLSMLLISAGLTATSLLLVRHIVQNQVKQSIVGDLQNSVSTFKNFQREREINLARSADLLADMPNMRALMTAPHEATIQDASTALWRLAGSDIFVLARANGNIVALHTSAPEFTREMAQNSLAASLSEPGPAHWWFGNQHLFHTSVKPIYFGAASENRLLGFLVIGSEIDDSVASQLSRVAASQVAFSYGDTIVRTTLNPAQEAELIRTTHPGPAISQLGETQLGGEKFLGTSLELAGGRDPSVRLTVLKSYDRATAFLDSLNHLLLGLGLAALAGGSLLVFFISHTFTRPLGSLVNGVRALENGDFSYPLDPHGGDEVAEVTGAFNRMRQSLLKTQQDLIDAERLATIGRMASSISHDLRHSLAAIVANAEFLCESHLSATQREELYQEVRVAVDQMTDLIDSLLEFSRNRAALRLSYGDLKNSAERAIHAIKAHPEFQHAKITVTAQGNCSGNFDQRKLERVLFNLVLNACEAVSGIGDVRVDLREVAGGVEIRVADNGRGIPESIREKLFEPFISYGKENGTGLGLTVVQKIVQDHGGDVTVEKTSAEGTIFRLFVPLQPASEHASPANGTPASAVTMKHPAPLN